MIDPLAEVVTLLKPTTPFSKIVSGKGPWRVRRTEAGRPFYCVILDGSCRLAVDGHERIDLEQGDFILVPTAYGFTMSSHDASSEIAEAVPVSLPHGEFRLGVPIGPPDVLLLVGYCVFGSPDTALLVSLLPQLVHVRGETRLAALVKLVSDESRAQRPAREIILARLLEVLLIEALRSAPKTNAPTGLLRGLADERLAVAIRRMHEAPARSWTVAQLAKEAALSRSAFFVRFNCAVGVAPMEYLLAWRMALAKDLLRRKESRIGEVAERVGYGSASAFSVAFTRTVGISPTQFAQARMPSQGDSPEGEVETAIQSQRQDPSLRSG